MRTDAKATRGTIGLVASLLILLCGVSTMAQSNSGAQLFQPGGTTTSSTTQYGSLPFVGNTTSPAPISIAPNLQSPVPSLQPLGNVSPYGSGSVLLAQNTTLTPAPIQLAPTGSLAAPVASSTTSPLALPLIDPYATPNQSSLFSSGAGAMPGTLATSGYNSNPSTIYSGNVERFVPETYDAMRRFREATSFEYTFLPGGTKEGSFGLGEIDLRMQLAFPCRFIPNTGTNRTGPGFFYIAPGGSLVWWEGPIGPPDMSPNGFGAFLDFGVQPQFNDVFAIDAWFRVGVFSDFNKVTKDAVRYQGRAMGLFTISPHVKIAAGVIYADRQHIKAFPTGGIIWTPRDDWIFRLTFPNPKISKKLWTRGTAEWWGYVNADFGGGSWEISGLGKTDYNDFRLGLGLEFETYSRVSGYFEFGGSFKRELYSSGVKWASPPNVLYLKTGFIF